MPVKSSVAVVLAVKALDAAKSRLSQEVPSDVQRREVVAAMLADTMAAVRGAEVKRFTVVSPDPAVHRLAQEFGGLGIDEPALISGLSPLNTALLTGIAASAATADLAAALQADLAALDTPTLRQALAAARTAIDSGAPAAFVADRSGEGTALLVVRTSGPLTPRFGPGSAAAHRAAGAVELDPNRLQWPRLRTDVDTPEDLATARELGLGPRTAAALEGSNRHARETKPAS
ncbi:2-phospho-L-lactate guanylyltransferase [Gordonia sp. (in: high G+C Gram-positive bacteria)]|uniref:2-phospho-L-lactate guanylyltransferase n=1 Tax=Gordonia sp. (in: high G+C Gram-positive bacteria) TaxID=84139 RepID=UPI003C721FA5